jgi:hypothetical protein
MIDEPEIPIWYPIEWEEEYKTSGCVQLWTLEYPNLFLEGAGSRRHLSGVNPSARSPSSPNTP